MCSIFRGASSMPGYIPQSQKTPLEKAFSVSGHGESGAAVQSNDNKGKQLASKSMSKSDKLLSAFPLGGSKPSQMSGSSATQQGGSNPNKSAKLLSVLSLGSGIGSGDKTLLGQ